MKSHRAAPYFIKIIFGVILGFSLSRIGFADYDELHKMFVFQDLRLFFTFIGALALSMVCFKVILHGELKVHRPLHKGTILGGIIFGLGWALSGGCPAIPLVQLGEGKLAALFSLAGIIIGLIIYRYVQRRFLRWDTGSCSS